MTKKGNGRCTAARMRTMGPVARGKLEELGLDRDDLAELMDGARRVDTFEGVGSYYYDDGLVVAVSDGGVVDYVAHLHEVVYPDGRPRRQISASRPTMATVDVEPRAALDIERLGLTREQVDLVLTDPESYSFADEFGGFEVCRFRGDLMVCTDANDVRVTAVSRAGETAESGPLDTGSL